MRSHPPTTAIIVAFVVTFILNYLGLIKFSERQLYDYYLRSRPNEARNNSIVIVGINEQDVKKYGTFLSDKLLANLLTKLNQGNPSVIGMDLHRNTSVGGGKEELSKVFTNTDNLIGVEKTDGGNKNNEPILPPKELEEACRTGASQIIEDKNNGIVRRGYLYANRSNKDSLPSLGLAVALNYLNQKEIFSTYYKNSKWLELGNSVFPELSKNLFYGAFDIDGNQILINYRSTKEKFRTISVSEILENKIKPSFFKDKIIFVGSVAETVDDQYLTPIDYVSQNSDFVFGVEIHAEMTNQIVNAALYNRTIIKPLTNVWQYLYIGLYLTIISYLSWYLFININTQNQQVLYFIYSIVSLLMLLSCGYLLLIGGWWVPTSTTFIISLVSEFVVYIALLKNTNEINKRQLEEAKNLLLSQERLKVYNKSASLIAHEIKNKVNSLESTVILAQNAMERIELFFASVSMLFEVDDASPLVENIDNVNNKLTLILNQSNQITLTINRIYATSINGDDSYKEDITVNIIDSINNILFDLLEKYNSKHPGNNLSLIKDFQLSSPNIIKIPLEIERAIENILENAFYFTIKIKKNKIPDNNWIPEIKISLRKQGNNLELKLKDNGIGISSKDIKRIFFDFYTTKSPGEGMGLGLYIAKESIQKFNGSISVLSVEGEYTEFTILLPIDRQIE